MKTPFSNIQILNANRAYQYIAAILANLGIICSEMHYGWTSHYIPELVHGNYTFQITSDEASWLTVIPLVGGIFGGFFTYMFVDSLGRKWLIVFSSLPFIASWILVGMAKSITWMFVGRILSGLADGLSFTVVPMYLAEIAQAEVRGRITSFCPLLIVVGLLLINIFGAYLPLDTTAYITIALPVLLLITFPWIPESPYFYIMKQNTDKARKSLKKFNGIEDVSTDLHRISMAVKEQNENKGSFFQLFAVKSIRKGMLICLGLRSIQQFSGPTVITFYCETVFEESRKFLLPSTATIIYFTLNLFVTVVSTFTVDRFGRRPLLIVSIIGTTLSLLANGIYLYIKNCTDIDTTGLDFIPVVALFCYVIVFSIGLQTIPYFIVGEVFPTNAKPHALCFLNMYHNGILAISSKFFHWSNDIYGMHVPFFSFAACCISGLTFVLAYVPETKGKTLEEILAELGGERKFVDRKLGEKNVQCLRHSYKA